MTEPSAPADIVPDPAPVPAPPVSGVSGGKSAGNSDNKSAGQSGGNGDTRGKAWQAGALALAILVAAVASGLAWNTQQRVKLLEAELVRRLQDSSAEATEARTLAREAETTVRASDARLALLEARVAESSMQRTQLEDLIQSLARSRDENVLADLDASMRMAMQQSAITGSADPLVLSLKQADERLARYNQPRLERVRRAIAADLERTRSAGVTDITALTIRLDEVIREIDDLPLLSAPDLHDGRRGQPPAAEFPAASTAGESSAANAGSARASAWIPPWRDLGARLWQQAKGLLRVTRIDDPDAVLVAPDQAFFLRENLKLRLLNARLALMSRQFDSAQSDLRDAKTALDRYFDRNSRGVAAATEGVRLVASQARLVTVPRPDATLAAIAAATAGR